jgi:uroporphyrinogen decarboxylase
MNSRERMLTVLNNGRPDRLPCQVHNWMEYYLNTYLNGMDVWEAYEKFDFDYAVYMSPDYIFNEKDLANWQIKHKDLGSNSSGYHEWEETIVTPAGELHKKCAKNEFTEWDSEHLVKNKKDFEIWEKYFPVPTNIDFTKMQQAKDKLGDKGIIRSYTYTAGQGSPWQSYCIIAGTEPAIYTAMDEPEYMTHALDVMSDKFCKAIEMWEGMPADLIETGGGAGSNTVISPRLAKKFCVPYDQKQNKLIHDAGLKVVYHLCGGLMHMLDLVVESGADGLETMTPASMGGDCNLKEASKKVGDKLFFVGGFDQNEGFEKGTPEKVRKQVFECFEATKDHAGYICSPSDHFFFGNPENLQAFVDACKECTY